MRRNDIPFESLRGLEFIRVSRDHDEEIIWFHTEHDGVYALQHHQDCCENVYIEDVVGDLNDLVGAEILLAEERTNREDEPVDDYEESYTWTYYTLRTIKGSVDIRFFGSSNGYYSESAQLDRIA